MDLVLALKFISSQLINKTIDEEMFCFRLSELVDEAGSEKNAAELMQQLAKFITEKP